MYPFVVTIVYPVRTAASQAAKTGSNPVGDANVFKGLHMLFVLALIELQVPVYKLPLEFAPQGAFLFPLPFLK